MIEFLQANASWIVLAVMFVLMMRMHGAGAGGGMGCCGGGGREHGTQAPERDQDGSIITKDPVCDMAVKASTAATTSEYKGKTYYFCSDDCKGAFEKNPEKFTQVPVPQHRMIGGG